MVMYRRDSRCVLANRIDQMHTERPAFRQRHRADNGEGGIRTRGTSLYRYDGLANRCLKPLGHLSKLLSLRTLRSNNHNANLAFTTLTTTVYDVQSTFDNRMSKFRLRITAMTAFKPKRKIRSDKFPLTLHSTGQFCKKIKGKIYYFGTNKNTALELYLQQAADLHAGRAVRITASRDTLSIKNLCNMYLDHQESRAAIGEIQARHVSDQVLLLRDFVRFVGSTRAVAGISTIELQNYRKRLINTGKSPHTINNRTAAVKAMYNWALDNEIIDHAPRLKALKKVTPAKKKRPTFTIAQIDELLRHATPQMTAMIWLGLNCGFGCTDCAELKWENVNLQNARVNFPRGKTGIGRNLPLWSETVQALSDLPVSGEFVFYTRRGNPWVRTTKSMGKNGQEKYKKTNNVSKEFAKLLKKAGIQLGKGVGFYTLRRTAATLTARSGDPFAVQKLLGHADLKMATTYVQDVSEQTDRAINNARKFVSELSHFY